MFHGSIVALVTPMRADGRLDEAAWTRLLDWHIESGTDGLVVAGTTGESPVLAQDEFETLLARAVERAGGRIKVLAGTGGASTARAMAQSARAAELGADGVLVVTPYYNRPPQRGLERHFLQVADAAGVPVVLYNVPARTGVDLLPETVARLAEHEGIVAIKEAVPERDRIRRLVAECGDRMAVISGDDATACRSLLDGAAGVITVAANVVPRRFARMCALARTPRAAEAQALHEELAPLFDFLGAESNPIPVKALLRLMGRIEAGIRLPLVPLADAHEERARQLTATLNLN